MDLRVFRLFCYYYQPIKTDILAYNPDWKCEKENLVNVSVVLALEAGKVLSEQQYVWTDKEAMCDFSQRTVFYKWIVCNWLLWAVSSTKQF